MSVPAWYMNFTKPSSLVMSTESLRVPKAFSVSIICWKYSQNSEKPLANGYVVLQQKGYGSKLPRDTISQMTQRTRKTNKFMKQDIQRGCKSQYRN